MTEKTKITYYGQSLFLIESSKGVKIGIDPYNKFVRAKLPDIEADMALVTHSHQDHSNISLFKGNPEVIKTTGINTIEGISIEGLPSYHDSRKGLIRGKNIIFRFEVDGIVFCHLGDLGDIPDADLISKLKDVNILFIPIGGFFTIDYKTAFEVIKKISPSIAIPMHYRDKSSRIKILDKIDNFLKLVNDYKLMESTINISKYDLPKNTEVWVLKSSWYQSIYFIFYQLIN